MQKTNSKPGFKLDIVIIVMGIIIVLVLLYILFPKNIFKDKYQKMEDEMVSKAKEYVLNNSISTDKEIYLDVNKLGVTLDDACSFTSGVIYNGTDYSPYLSCNEYKSNIIPNNDLIRDYITLKGEEVMVLAKGMNFYDPGYFSKDIITKIGNVGTEEGVYSIFYKTTNSNNFAVRKVIVLDNEEVRKLYPTISLVGEDNIFVVQNRVYKEQGVESTDTVDGNISSRVLIEGRVDTTTVGEYKLSYVITNSRGYSNTITRTVNVLSEESDLVVNYSITPESLTNENVTVKLSISGDFDKIVYPDETEGKELEYTITENGFYKFYVYDEYNREVMKQVEISNIDRTKPEGNCKATLYYDRTEVKVTITNNREISSYEYNLGGKITTSQSNTLKSTVVQPATIKVKIKDIVNNQNEITCSIKKDLERKIVTDAKGKNCLEGYKCYVQFDYGNAGRYPFCSMSNNPNSCGGIGRNGCSITSATNAIAAMGKKSSDGTLYNPYSVWSELYPINKSTGKCNGGCSGWSRIRDAVVNAGLTAPKSVSDLNKNTMSMVTENLKKGYPVIVYSKGAPFAGGSAHYMTLLAINSAGQVFLSDSANVNGTKKAYYNGRQYYVDTWIPTSDLISGNVKEFLLVGPPGMYQGK